MTARRAEQAQDRITLSREEALRGKERYWIFRRVQDVFFSALALVVLMPPMLIVALLIVIDSPGAGPIFVQTRVGRDGREFRLYKFRTMVPNAEKKLKELLKFNEMKGPAFKIKKDPRITRIGKFLRKSGIDELPQLLNVLKGDMSIVGPRPPLPREVAQYGPYELQRLYITPGITCYWQIQPRRNELSFRDWVALDIRYIRERSFAVDWKIIFRTFITAVTLQGR